MFNEASVKIQGRLGRDPETRATIKGGEIVTLSVAVNKRIKDQTAQEYTTKAHWFDVSIIKPELVEKAKKSRKGAYVSINGELEKDEYKDKEGNNKQVTRIVLLEDNSGFSYINTPSEKSAEASNQ